MHGTVRNKVLVKTGNQVVFFWKHKGYAVSETDLEEVRGVELHTKYHGILYAPRHLFYTKGIKNLYNGEQQLILPLHEWETLTGRNEVIHE